MLKLLLASLSWTYGVAGVIFFEFDNGAVDGSVGEEEAEGESCADEEELVSHVLLFVFVFLLV
ncbi:hypothetical protein P5E51_15805, partial [Clostridium perfringens]|nr:hypothetical protein [Clostridium perfringens]